MNLYYSNRTGKLTVFVITLMIILNFIVCLLPDYLLYAGVSRKVVVSDEFLNSSLNTEKWKVLLNQGISAKEDFNGLIIKEAYNGTGIITKNKVGGAGAIVEVDFKELDIARSGGWVGFMFGSTKSTVGGSFFADAFADPKKGWQLHYIRYLNGNYQFIDHKNNKVIYHDGLGNEVSNQGGAYNLDLYNSEGKDNISNIRLRAAYGADGSYELSVYEIGENNEIGTKKILLVSDPSTPLPIVRDGFVGLPLMEGTNKSFGTNITVENMKVYLPSNGKTADKLIAQFDKTGSNKVLNMFNSFSYPGTKMFYSGVKSFINFSPELKNSNTFIIKNKISMPSVNDVKQDSLVAEFDIKLNKIAGDKKFGVVFGLEDISKKVGDANSSYLYFSNQNGNFTYGFDYYAKPKGYDFIKHIVKISERKLANIPADGNLKIKLLMNSDQSIKMYFNGVYTAFIENIDYSGNMGFALTGANTDKQNYVDVDLNYVNVENFLYERPQNRDIRSDFNNGTINSKDWFIRNRTYLNQIGGIYPKNGGVIFDNVAIDAEMSTLNKYSNFEFKFDILDIRRQVVKSSNGTKVFPVSSWIGVVFGLPKIDEGFGNIFTKYPLVLFEAGIDEKWEKNTPTRVVIWGIEGAPITKNLSKKYDFWDISNASKIVNTKISVIDGFLKVFIKYSSEPDIAFEKVVDINIGSSLTGYVGIWGMGDPLDQMKIATCGNFTLDNISITNRDTNPQIISSGSTSEIEEQGKDFVYSDPNNDSEYLVKTRKAGLTIPYIAVISGVLVILIIAILLLLRRVKKTKSIAKSE